MEKPSPSQPAKTSPSITFVLKEVSDDKALVLFNRIARADNYGIVIGLKETKLSTQQYYSRISGLVKAGLIKRKKGKYFPTSLGKVVYDSQSIIREALSQHWKLKAIDQIETSHSDLPTEDATRLINVLINNHRIKDVLIKQAEVACVEARSETIF